MSQEKEVERLLGQYHKLANSEKAYRGRPLEVAQERATIRTKQTSQPTLINKIIRKQLFKTNYRNLTTFPKE